eukprot:TRINITY_DN4280_c0_g1_i1.p1 TRINITY_DN4280_c0_g1~~TRINITY_DN4280_c0_g1_i1.p1  ORF type:complete len:147 (+),score=44.63 TRINITY_DN4280_c0_g1_i1:178-618(+)
MGKAGKEKENEREDERTSVERDVESRRVPEMKPPPPPPSSDNGDGGLSNQQQQGGAEAPAPVRKRGAGSSDREHKKLKRLLRNRVSAQQARERKKVYLTDLEVRGRDLEQRNAELEEKVSTLQRENFMLRQIVKNTALKKPAPEVQ